MVYAQKNPIAYKEKPADSAKMNEEFTQVYSILNDLEDTKADLASPALTGTPTAPTPTVGDNSTKVATTAFVNTEISNDRPYATASPLMDGTAAVGVSAKVAREDHKHPTDTSRAASSHTHGGGDITSAVANATSAASCSGNAATATKLATARTISLTGDVTGSASFDGSANASITATVADDPHNHTIANVDNLQTTLDGKVPTGRTVTAGNGLTGGGALSGNITLTMGTPGSCSTSTSNAVTATSHTHAITGVAAASHTHSYAPIPTSSALPVGMTAYLMNYNGGTLSNGGTTSGNNLRIVQVSVSSGAPGAGGTPSGTWKNITGLILSNQTVGLFVRTA